MFDRYDEFMRDAEYDAWHEEYMNSMDDRKLCFSEEGEEKPFEERYGRPMDDLTEWELIEIVKEVIGDDAKTAEWDGDNYTIKYKVVA